MDKRVWPLDHTLVWPMRNFKEGQLIRIGENIYEVVNIAERQGDYQITLVRTDGNAY